MGNLYHFIHRYYTPNFSAKSEFFVYTSINVNKRLEIIWYAEGQITKHENNELELLTQAKTC